MVSILGFVTRKLFLDSLGEEYLGLNGLLTNVIGMLSLVESGVGVSIVYNLYKPLAEGEYATGLGISPTLSENLPLHCIRHTCAVNCIVPLS